MDKDAIRNALIHYEMLVTEQQHRIKLLRLQLDRDADFDKTTLEFTKVNEDLYLRLKSFIHEIRGDSPSNLAEDIGTTDIFPSALEEIKDGVWRFTLPPFYSVPVNKRSYNEGKHIYYLVINLLREYELDVKKIKKMERPVVVLRHHICASTDKVFDYDNIDSKRAIDALQGYFLKDDNSIYLTTVHEAVEDERISYCEMFIYDQAKKGELTFPFQP